MKKAKCLGFAYYVFDDHGYRSPVFEYEYRGYTYNCIDYRNGCSESLAQQHFFRQCQIDKMIEINEAEAKRPHRYEDTAEYGLNKFFEYYDSEED